MRIFLSYSPEDRDIADRIKQLVKAAGHIAWEDVEGIVGGNNWRESLEYQIKSADWVLVLLSSNQTKTSQIDFEIMVAREYNKHILGIITDDVQSEDLPILLRNIPTIDARNNSSEAAGKILSLLKGDIPELEKQAAKIAQEDIQIDEPNRKKPALPDRIFVAYSHKQRPLAHQLYEMLIKNGKAVFYDQKLKAGAVWRQMIQKALDDATHVVVIWTSEAALSDEVEREVSYALAERKVIVPILSKEIPRLPYHLHGLHYIVLEDDLAQIEQPLLKAIEQFSANEDIWQ